MQHHPHLEMPMGPVQNLANNPARHKATCRMFKQAEQSQVVPFLNQMQTTKVQLLGLSIAQKSTNSPNRCYGESPRPS